MPLHRTLLTGALLAAATLASSTATAQQGAPNVAGTALDRYEAAPYGDVLMGVPMPHVWGHLRPAGGAMLNFSYRPLVLLNSAEDEELGEVVSYQVIAHAMASLELFERLKLDVNVPLTVTQAGESPGEGDRFASPSGFAMNDIRVGARVEVLKQNGYWPSAALAFNVWLPTGDDEQYTGTGDVRYAPSVIVGGDYDDFVWTTTVSRRFQTFDASDLLGSEIHFGAGLGPRFGDLLLSAEIFGSVVTQGQSSGLAFDPALNLEAHAGASYDLGPLRLRVAGGPGISRGAGTPDFRVLASVGYVMEVDREAATKRSPGSGGASGDHVAEGGAGGAGGDGAGGDGAGGAGAATPVPAAPIDSDADGVTDDKDACPTRAGDPGNAMKPGCPADADQDGTPDTEDACPKEKGVRSSDPKQDGCPPDTDGDGLRDPQDACPNERGEPSKDPKSSGCPAAVRVVGEQIVILQKVEFQTGRAVILEQSKALLKQVADVLQQHPEIVRLAVDGHTDSTGSKSGNIILSQKRALAVMQWLVGEGNVDSRRVEARGFGPRQPIADNGSKEGRSKNRRVEFQILKRDLRGEAAWQDGTVEGGKPGPKKESAAK